MRVRWRTLGPLQAADPRVPTVDGIEAVAPPSLHVESIAAQVEGREVDRV
jgi:hypothetical protein